MRMMLSKLSVVFALFTLSIPLFGQEDYSLETRYRNPIDTVTFHQHPTMLLFVHSKCQHGYLCPTTRMQKSLECDSLGFRDKFGINLFVVYPKYSQYDINIFDSFKPTDNTTIAFYTSKSHQGIFNEGGITPHIIFYDGKGSVHTMTGGAIEELNDSVCNRWQNASERCGVSQRTGKVNKYGGY